MKRYVLIGLDGSGKSTNIDRMKQDPLFHEYSFIWVRWEPKLLRPLYWFLHKRTSKKDGKTDGVAHQPQPGSEREEAGEQYDRKQGLKKRIFSNRLFGKIWILLALIDYWLQFYCKLLFRKKKKQGIVFDRYYFDLFVDQGLNIGYSPERIVRAIRRHAFLFPKVHKAIYIRANPEVCIRRKHDIPSMDYLVSRYSVYEFLSREPGWITVDGEKSLEEVYASIKEGILED